MPRTLLRAKDLRASLPNSPSNETTEETLALGRYFEADCLVSDAIGDFVSITGAPVVGFPQVTKVSGVFPLGSPAVGVVISKETSTRCLVQTFGIYTTTGLIPGARYWCGSDARATTTRPATEAQSVGIAISDSQIVLQFEIATGFDPNDLLVDDITGDILTADGNALVDE